MITPVASKEYSLYNLKSITYPIEEDVMPSMLLDIAIGIYIKF
jgi:hypothetical protein